MRANEEISIDAQLLDNVSQELQILPVELLQWLDVNNIIEENDEHFTDQDIINQVTSTVTEEDDEENLSSQEKIFHKQAVDSFETCLDWAEENGISSNELMLLRRLRDKAIKARFNVLKQPNIVDFIHKC